MPFNFSRIFGPLTAHQYINRVKMAGVVTFPLTFFYATYSNKSLDVQPILDTRLSPLYVEGYVDMWNEQSSLLKPYWAEGEKRNALTEEQKIELDFLKSLRWSLRIFSDGQTQLQLRRLLLQHVPHRCKSAGALTI